MEEKVFGFDKRHRFTVKFSAWFYIAFIVLMTLEAILSALDLYGANGLTGFWSKLLFNRERNSLFLLLVFVGIDLYCMLSITQNLLILSRISKVNLHISEGLATGFAFATGKGWKDGESFSLTAADIASVGVTECKLIGNTQIPTIVINTLTQKYYLPGLEKGQDARKLLETL